MSGRDVALTGASRARGLAGNASSRASTRLRTPSAVCLSGAGARATGLAFALAVLTGCATTPSVESRPPPAQGEVGAALLTPEGDGNRLSLARGQRFIYPTFEQPGTLPGYPEDLLAQRLAPVEICLDVVVGVQGDVIAVAERDDVRCTTVEGVDRQPFVTPALDAARTWSYLPALLCRAPDGYEGDDPCQADGATETPTPVRLSYSIRFSQHDGVPMVERGE